LQNLWITVTRLRHAGTSFTGMTIFAEASNGD